MVLPINPNEKFEAVKEAYLGQIIPSIRLVYERTNLVRESFILTHCAILSLSGFYAGSKDTNSITYKKYVSDFFPKGYESDKLWKYLRNDFIHAYTMTGPFRLAHKHPELHLVVDKGVKHKLTGVPADVTYLNFESFLDDFEKSANIFFEKAKVDPNLTANICKRHDISPPVNYISDREMAKYSKNSIQP